MTTCPTLLSAENSTLGPIAETLCGRYGSRGASPEVRVPAAETAPLRHTQRPTSGLYPAADVLARFGDAAVPALRNAVRADTDSNKTRRVNAARVLFPLLKDRAELIRLLIEISQASQDHDLASALSELANQMVRYCDPKDAERCRSASRVQ